MARYLACIISRMFTRGQAFVDRGVQEYENRRAQRELASLQSKAAAHGFRLVNLQNRDAFPVQEFPANSEQFMERSIRVPETDSAMRLPARMASTHFFAPLLNRVLAGCR
jgi:hypothetical protein